VTATLRTQRARSRQAQSGAKRVEVVLDAETAGALEYHRSLSGGTTAAFVTDILRSAFGLPLSR
jgi:hypothetical protein